jgi:phospholipid/cholesterol/gamma-HCH transport system substrate-binding protein
VNKPAVLLGVGFFLATAVFALAIIGFLAGRSAGLGVSGYDLHARFISASGIAVGTRVELAGVRVGEVAGIALDAERFQANVRLRVIEDVAIPKGATASIRSSGLIGERFIRITPGPEDEVYADGDEIRETESAINIEELLAKYVFAGER